MSIDLTLQRIETLSSHLEAYTRPTVHIAGTNGKGSVSAILTKVLIASGLKVGRFNSPHLITVLDSITINDSAIGVDTYESIRAEIETTNERLGINASNFEVLTITALLIFERARVDVVILEVGMGGRLDATNVIPDASVLVSVITSIDLDHTGFLGSTIEAISREKAGIIRLGRPVLLSYQQHSGVENVVREVCKDKGATLTLAPVARSRSWNEEIDGLLPRPFSLEPFSPPPPRPVEVAIDDTSYKLLLPLHGDHQLVNMGTAMTAIHTLTKEPSVPSYIREKLSALQPPNLHNVVQTCRWPGRLSFHSYSSSTSSKELVILADGAHNEGGAKALASYVNFLLDSLSRSQETRAVNLSFVIGLSHSPPKTPASVIMPLLSPASEYAIEGLDIVRNVAFARFSMPEGMPWVKPVQPEVMGSVVRELNSSVGPHRQWNIWTEPEEQDLSRGFSESSLGKALEWVKEQARRHDAAGRCAKDLVIVAGSLYLVADLYRLLHKSKKL